MDELLLVIMDEAVEVREEIDDIYCYFIKQKYQLHQMFLEVSEVSEVLLVLVHQVQEQQVLLVIHEL